MRSCVAWYIVFSASVFALTSAARLASWSARTVFWSSMVRSALVWEIAASASATFWRAWTMA